MLKRCPRSYLGVIGKSLVDREFPLGIHSFKSPTRLPQLDHEVAEPAAAAGPVLLVLFPEHAEDGEHPRSVAYRHVHLALLLPDRLTP